MCLEVKSAYQKSSWFESLFHETNLGCGGLSRGPGACYPENFENGPPRFGKNAFTAYSYSFYKWVSKNSLTAIRRII